MPERRFTKQFKENLANELNRYFQQPDVNIHLACQTEYQLKTGSITDQIDIAILRSNEFESQNPTRIVGIEIEVISSPDQIPLNYEKFKKWVHNSPGRIGGLLHIITSETNIDERSLSELLFSSYADTSRGLGMYYEVYALNDVDHRKSAEIAVNLVQYGWEFDVRLFALITKVFGRWYLPKRQ